MKKILKQAIKNYGIHEISLYSAAFTYTTLLSLPALILTILFISELLFGSSTEIQNIIESSADVLPWSSSQVLTQFLNNSIELTGVITWAVTLWILIFSGTRLITFFTKAINNSFGLRMSIEKQTFLDTLKLRLFWLLFIVLFIWVIAFSIIFSTVFSWLLDNPWLWYILNFMVSFLIYSLLYAFILRFMVLVKLSYKQSLIWWAFVSILTIISIALITLALNSINLTSDFALWASIVLFLIWINYLSTVIFFGFECINVYLRENGVLQVASLADEKYHKDIVLKSSLLERVKWAFWVLSIGWKIWAWFLKRKWKKKRKHS